MDSIPCSECGDELLKIRSKSFIYTFNLSKAPSLFIKIYEELKNKTLKNAYKELFEVTDVFCDE